MVKLPTDRAAWQRVQTLFAEALDRPRSEREAFLSVACQGDLELQEQVVALLEADRQDDTFLDAPAAVACAEFVESLPVESPPQDPLIGREVGPYRIVRLVGAGGMGQVYEAHDGRLDRRVALKFLAVPSTFGLQARNLQARERFLSEARAVSGLDHPNIGTVHDLGETRFGPEGENRLFIVFAYYEGQTLAQRLDRGPLEPDEARAIATQIARGLRQAHRQGIIHRDVKPANVMLVHDADRDPEPERLQAPFPTVKLLDFGIAKIAHSADLTRTGASPGTPAYMSPEQIRGDRVDARTDLWSLGVLLYEMLAGQRPFRGDHQTVIFHQILEGSPEPLRVHRPDIPPVFERTITKALAKDPAQRQLSADEFLADLQGQDEPPSPARRSMRALWLGGLGFLMLVGWLGMRVPTLLDRLPTDVTVEKRSADTIQPGPQNTLPVVGVLPFVNRTEDESLDWIGAGLARLLSDDLARSRHLHVVSAPRLASIVAGGPETPSRLAAEAGIEMLLTGEILPNSEGLVVAARLEETQSGRQRTARRLEGLDAGGLLGAADAIAREIRKGLEVPLAEAVDVFAADFAAAHPSAYEHYIAGLEAFTAYRYPDAERAFQSALNFAPGFVMARYRLAFCLAATGRTREALDEIQKALAEVDRLPDREARYVRAGEATIARRNDEAIETYRGIVERYPYETEARMSWVHLLSAQRRHREALDVAEELIRLEPENGIAWSLAGSARLALGEVHQAAHDFERYLALAPESANAQHLLGDAYRAQGELDLAASAYESALGNDPQFHAAGLSLALVEALQDRLPDAITRLEPMAYGPGIPARYRVDAAFELAALKQARGQFHSTIQVIREVKGPVAAESIREAHAHSIVGYSWLALGDLAKAAREFDRALELTPGLATRYLYARGRLELAMGRLDQVDKTIASILADAFPPENPDRTEDKAAASLRGLARLAENRADEAVIELTRAVSLDGYEYAAYRLQLAKAYLADGRLREALAAANQTVQQIDPNDPRLDLAADRTRALLVLARIYRALDQPEAARKAAQAFLDRWADADPGLPELDEAQRLASDAG